jgi:hypothetical protein
MSLPWSVMSSKEQISMSSGRLQRLKALSLLLFCVASTSQASEWATLVSSFVISKGAMGAGE